MKTSFAKKIWLGLTSILVVGTFFHANAFAELKTEVLKPEITEAQRQTEKLESRARKLKRNITETQRKAEVIEHKMRHYRPKTTDPLRPMRSENFKNKMGALNIRPKIGNSSSPIGTQNLEHRAKKLNQGITETQRKSEDLERKMRDKMGDYKPEINTSPIGGQTIYQPIPRLDSLELNRNSFGSFGR